MGTTFIPRTLTLGFAGVKTVYIDQANGAIPTGIPHIFLGFPRERNELVQLESGRIPCAPFDLISTLLCTLHQWHPVRYINEYIGLISRYLLILLYYFLATFMLK